VYLHWFAHLHGACFQVLASIVFYGHRLSKQQWGGVALVMAGLGLELAGKFKKDQSRGRIKSVDALK
jgi:hypothetical protein